MHNVIAEFLQCFAAYLQHVAMLADDTELEPADAKDIVKLAAQAPKLYAAVYSPHAAQCAALDSLETNCLNMLDTNVRDFFANLYTVNALFRSNEL